MIAIVLSGVGSAGGSSSTSATGATSADVQGVTVPSAFVDPITGAMTITESLTPPDPIGTFAGCHFYAEIPDQSANPTFVVGTSPVGSASVITGPWVTIDLGKLAYDPTQPSQTLTAPAPTSIDFTVDNPCRLYAVAYSTNGTENALVRATQSGATPNVAFTLGSLASGSPTSGTNVTTLTGGDGGIIGIVATVESPDNSTGKLVTPVLVALSDTPPSTSGWVAQLVLTVGGADPTVAANQQVVTSAPITQAGFIYQTGDGIPVAHSFAIPTPKTITTGVVWLQAGLVDANGVTQWNNIFPGITPHFPITYGSTVGVTDASAIMTATINSAMAVVAGLFGVAAAGITNPYMGTGAVATINLQALAVTNPILASLAVQAGNLANSSVTATAIANLAVGTAAMQLLAVDTTIIANAAVSNAKIVSATITGASIASATIAGANIATATIVQANMAAASIGTAQIQSLAVTDALIASLSATKLTAGTISATISITSPTITATNGFVVTAGGLTTTISNAVFNGANSGLSVSDGSTGTFVTQTSFGIVQVSGGTQEYAIMSVSGGVGFMQLFASSSVFIELVPQSTASTASAGSATLPSNPIAFMPIIVNTSHYKIPLYGV